MVAVHKKAKGRKHAGGGAPKGSSSLRSGRRVRFAEGPPSVVLISAAGDSGCGGSPSGDRFNYQRGRSKVALMLIELLFPLGFLGLDRLYMNCPRSALVKLMLFLFGLSLVLISESHDVGTKARTNTRNVGLSFLLIWFFIGLFDLVAVVLNGVTRSSENPFCSGDAPWKDPHELKYGAVFAIALILIQVAAMTFMQVRYDFFRRLGGTLPPTRDDSTNWLLLS